MNFVQKKSSRQAGWTFVEMLVAISISALAIGAAAIVFSSISHNAKRLTSLVDVEIGTAANSNFYDVNATTIRTYAAPNFGTIAKVQQLRDRFIEDLSYSTACYALPRSGLNTVRNEYLEFPPGVSGATDPLPQLDTPEAFRQFLHDVEPDAVSIFDSPIRNVPSMDPADRKPSSTIFLLGPLVQDDYIRLNAVYEIDVIEPTGKPGIYVSVRRYKNGVRTDYYDVYYPNGSYEHLTPNFVTFERKARLLKAETPAIDMFKVAPGAPFYFVWFPDPSINHQPMTLSTAAAAEPRDHYEHLAGKTSFMVVAPMFPSL